MKRSEALKALRRFRQKGKYDPRPWWDQPGIYAMNPGVDPDFDGPANDLVYIFDRIAREGKI